MQAILNLGFITYNFVDHHAILPVMLLLKTHSECQGCMTQAKVLVCS